MSAATTIAWALDCLAVTETTAAEQVDTAPTRVATLAGGPGTTDTLRAVTFGAIEGTCPTANNDMLVLRVVREGDDGLDDNPNPAFLHFVEVSYTAER